MPPVPLLLLLLVLLVPGPASPAAASRAGTPVSTVLPAWSVYRRNPLLASVRPAASMTRSRGISRAGGAADSRTAVARKSGEAEEASGTMSMTRMRAG